MRHIAPRRGLTVLEVLVALTVFGLVSVVIFTVFATAIRSQGVTEREVDTLQRARVVMDTFTRDLNNVFFRDETSYNVTISRLLEEQERERLRAEAEGDWTNFINLYGDPFGDGTRRRDREEDPSVGDPFRRGRLIDVQFKGTEGEDFDSVSFATYSPLDMGGTYRPWGLSRVTYRVDNNILVRVQETVESERMDLLGNLMLKAYTPEVSRLAEGVREFKLAYSFWFDNEWFEINDWASDRRQVRNSNSLMALYEEDRFGSRDEEGRELRPGDPGYNERLNYLDDQDLDRLPAYVRMRLTLADPESERHERTFTRIIRVFPSVETYIPNMDLDENERDAERNERRDSYTVVFPGALEE